VKTLQRRSAIGAGVTAGLVVGAATAVVYSAWLDAAVRAHSHRLELAFERSITGGAVVGGTIGLVVGAAAGTLVAIFLLRMGDAEIREWNRTAPEPVSTLPLGNIFPTGIAPADAFETVRRELEADKRAEDAEVAALGAAEPEAAAPAPALVPVASPASCSACGQSLETDADAEPLRFCYHCGAELR
jgi:hypothetical protein